MNGYRVTLTCPFDGAELNHEAGGATNGWTARSIARCPECNAQLLVEMTVRCANENHRRKPGTQSRPTTRHAKAAAVSVSKEEGDEIAAAVLQLCARLASKGVAA